MTTGDERDRVVDEPDDEELEKEFMAIMEGIYRNVEKHGQHIVSIPDATPPFSYTIGNHECGLPELLLFDLTLSEDTASTILNRLGRIMRDRRKAFDHGEMASLGGKCPVKIIDTSREVKEEFTLFVGVYYGTDDYRVQQVVLCDIEGRFPGDPDCSEPYASQLVLAAN